MACETRAMARLVISVTESVLVDCPPDEVFDFTQDYAHRAEWDAGVTSATVLGEEPRIVRVAMRGLGEATLTYQLFRRPERTSAAFGDVKSAWICGGGGSWQYEATEGGTTWQQTNTLELKRPRLMRFMAGYVERSLRDSTRKAMAAAKARLEGGAGAG